MDGDAPSRVPIILLLHRRLDGLMRVDDHELLRPPDSLIAFRGHVYGDTEPTFDTISERFARLGYTAWLRNRFGQSHEHEVIAVKGLSKARPTNTWLNVVLALATLLSVLTVGASYALGDANIITESTPPSQMLLLPLIYLYRGLPFAGTLMGILLAHELSHYFVARRYGSPVSLPYFIPMPFSILGTMGALIVQRAPMRNRKALLDIGIAGPLGGLIVALPLLILGLLLSDVGPPPPGVEEALQEGNSLIYSGLKYLVFGRFLPAGGEDVWLHPVAFAAWAGLLVTMINLIPVGQLDGGHVSYALLGNRAHRVSQFAVAAMLVWGGWTLWTGNQAGGFWVTWGLMNLFLNRKHPPPLDEATPLGAGRIGVGLLAVTVFILTFMPAPLRVVAF